MIQDVSPSFGLFSVIPLGSFVIQLESSSDPSGVYLRNCVICGLQRL